MNTALIERQALACEAHARHLQEALPYADGMAYTQDKDRIRDLLNEARQWREILEYVKGAKAA